MTRTFPCLLGAACLSAFPALAQQAPASTPPSATTLDRVVVTARLQGVPAFDLPASVDVVGLGEDSDRAGISLSEDLAGLPGVSARERQNYAQDTQLSIRGFGARSSFGVRGIRLYADGIPATMPDGQGQLSHFNLLAGDTLEVMRGPFSALYGNSSGGVVQLWSADGDGPLQTLLRSTYGSHGSRTVGARLLGKSGNVGYNFAASTFDTDGWREHSATRRRSANLKLDFGIGETGKLDLIANAFDAPDAQDPLGLTRQQVRDNPRQAAVADTYDTRKSVRQNQLGLRYVQPFGHGQQLTLSGYGGHRSITQYLAIPPSAQANPLHAGGVVAPDTGYHGIDARWSWRGELAGRAFEITAGANADDQRQRRRGYKNFVGGTLGVRGRLRRDERNIAGNVDEFAQVWWQLAPRWSLLAGVRHSRVRIRNEDFYVTAGNPDDSGRVRYDKTTPVAGLAFAASDDLRLYASAGRGFETPTLNELGYRADGGAGLAFDLKPSSSRNLELGGKWRGAGGAAVQAALFRADSDDELAVASSVGGRSRYRNVGRTRRQGAEISLAVPLARDWDATLAYTWLDATFRDGFASGTTQVAAGTRLPATARQQLSARLQWHRGDWQWGAEGLANAGMTANDAGTARAAGYGLLNLEASHGWRFGTQRLRAFARIENVFDRAYVGSVIVNDGNGRYYEPGPDRSVLVGLQWNTGG